MITYLTPAHVFVSAMQPSEEATKYHETVSPFLPYCNQSEFNKILEAHSFETSGSMSSEENSIIKEIKNELNSIDEENKDVNVDRLEFDYAISFHKNLKRLKWGKAVIPEIGMWRYLSLNYFKEEVYNRRGKSFFNKGDHVKAAKNTFDHSFGTRARDIFPRRYFIIGERLYSETTGYDLLEKLSNLSKKNRNEGGFGNFKSNLIDTSLLSPKDYVSKVMSKVMFSEKKLANDKEVAKAFVRYNGFKSRLINDAVEKLFVEEICVLNDTKV